MEIKPIETEYDGYRFRSRLEARWAVFFNALKIKYQYEVEGFTGCGGTPYLPDFYYPDYDIYGEVKGTDRQLFECQEKISGAIDLDYTPVSKGLLLLGPIPYRDDEAFDSILGDYLHWDARIRLSLFRIFSCDGCGQIRLCGGNASDAEDYPNIPTNSSVEQMMCYTDYDDFRFMEALMKARSSRFEYGECG